jgi:UDP-glucose 4-epimerase
MSVILVTGAAGYIGGHLINSLLEDECFSDYYIRGIDNFLVGKRRNYALIRKSPRVKLLKMDFTKAEDVKEMIKDVEIVYHLGAISGVVFCNHNPAKASHINVEGTRKLLEVASNAECERFIFPSSTAVYGNSNVNPITEEVPCLPQNIYGALKISAEAFCDVYYYSYGLGTTILRWTNIYGKGTYMKWRTVIPAFVRRAVSGETLLIHGSGKQKRNFIHIDDVVDLYKAVIDKRAIGEKFNAGGKSDISIRDLAEMVKRIGKERFGIAVKVEYAPARDLTPERQFSTSIEKLEKVLKWKPEISLEEGVMKVFKSVIEEGENGFYEGQKEVV